MRLIVAVVALVVALTSCSTQSDTTTNATLPAREQATATITSPGETEAGGHVPSANPPEIPKLPSALPGADTQPAKKKPVSLTIQSLNIVDAPVDGVGVEPNGEMEVPSAKEVGWYSFGSTPGDPGSAVLAAHIAEAGVNGVFRYLQNVKPGAQIDVAFEDGSTKSFVVTELEQYNKSSLPFDDIFRRSGDAQLTLITCGGDFNQTADSYEDNIVAYAQPI